MVISQDATRSDIDTLESRLFDQLEQLSPQALKDAAAAWAQAIAGIVGKDDGSRDLTADLASYVETVNRRAPMSSAKIILNEISEAVESQWDLARHLHEAVADNHYSGKAAPMLADDTYPEAAWIPPQSALTLLDFLKKPISPPAVAAFEAALPKFQGKAEQFYQAFWSLSNDQRADFLGKVVRMPATKNVMFTMILGQLKGFFAGGFGAEFLPPPNPARGDDSAHEIGSKVIGALMAHPPEPKLLLRCFASALDAVHDDLCDQASLHPRTADPHERFGYRLGRFMNNLGPGAAKTAQFGHSLPVTPDAWMPGLSASKSDAGRPSRYEYLTWARERVAPDVRDHIVHIGAHKGTGSYLSTYGIELDRDYLRDNPNYERYRQRYADKNLVLSIKKPNAREDSLEFTQYLLELGENIARLSPEASRSVAPLIELVKQGMTMVEKETDLSYSARQETLTGQLYEDLKILLGSKSGNYTAGFYTQGAFEHGDDFRVSLCVEGLHFNQLPEETASQKAIRRRAAISFFTPALYIMLSGRPFNHDDHGDNNGVVVDGNKIHIGKFDSGAQALEEPTTAQKIVFADCLVNALINSKRNHYNLFSSLKHTIAKTSAELGPDRQEELDYVNSMLRATVSLGDYMRHMKGKDYKHALLAVLQTGEVDPVILSRIADRAGAFLATEENRKVLNVPIVSDIARAVGRLSSLSGIEGCTVAQVLADALQQETGQAGKFYPNNPNPQWDPDAARERKKHRTKQSGPETIRVRIENEGPEDRRTFAGRVSGSLATGIKAAERGKEAVAGAIKGAARVFGK